MVVEIPTHAERIKRLKKEYKANPEKYLPVPGKTYYIVVCDSHGNPIRTRGRKRISPENTVLKILPLPDGLEKELLTHSLT